MKSPSSEPNFFKALQKKAAGQKPGPTCFSCDGPSTEFKDELSKREHAISGLCQACQDIAFAIPEDEQDLIYPEGPKDE